MIEPDGIAAAALREQEAHPTSVSGKPITAWERRRWTLERTIGEVNQLRDELDVLKGELRSRPF